ncbi:MAG: sulfite exporter TauE/SafE family protein [Armatimonadota bacterium]|nr:sulfite exporter TauE/SafE family protein [Armatimonadota bacterium]MDR7412734.1 sulfite exporter TauE/SafE family protein [Armatimonadota bacterium]MDR7429031.1 sulfite exporter TauE/SafE family protein [Armatimonadota bacterium]MDR7445966.1 sulfite exporter TauE/SafE family protein [Armatimonadota bacterium]MDR7460827.1 sulfite exporter TauE/SafE family protein [Armatimonadota bacterium]
MSFALLLGAAFVLGVRHALDPDHLVAVSTLVAEERRLWPAARLGLWWGAGHLLPIAAVGLPLLALRVRLPEAWEHTVDLGVGVLLVVLGLRTLWVLRRERVHFHVHEHDGRSHPHFHTHLGGPDHAHTHTSEGARGRISFLIGVVHGLAGSGAAAVVAMTAATSLAAGVAYLLAFGVGTWAGMFLTSLCIAAPTLAAVSRWERLYQIVRASAGLASVAVGVGMWLEILPALL